MDRAEIWLKNKLFCALKRKNSEKVFQLVQTRGKEEPRNGRERVEYIRKWSLANVTARKSRKKTPANEKAL